MQSVCQIQPFIQLFRALQLGVDQEEELINQKYITAFLSKIQFLQNCQEQSFYDQQNKENQLENWKSVIAHIQNIQNSIFSQQIQIFDINVEELEQNNASQIIKVLKLCFIIASKSINSSYFIQNVIKLPESSQIYFADLLKPLCPATPPSRKQSLEYYSSSQKKLSTFSQYNTDLSKKQINLIDKLYEYQQELEKFQLELKRTIDQNAHLQQQNKQYKTQVVNMRIQNEQLRLRIIDDQYLIDILKNNSENLVSNERKTNSLQKHCQLKDNSIINDLNNEVETLKILNENIHQSFNKKIQDLSEDLKLAKNKAKSYQDKAEQCKEMVENLDQKCQQYQTIINNIKVELNKIKDQNQLLSQAETALKFQLGYKNSQIQELKELLMDKSIGNRQDLSAEFSKYRESNLLQNQFEKDGDQNDMNGQKGYTLRNFQLEELKALRISYKEYQREAENFKQIKARNKQLEYEKKKLLKILKQYQVSRGEQNDILTGCIYELQKRLSGMPPQLIINSPMSIGTIKKKFFSATSTQGDLQRSISENKN